MKEKYFNITNKSLKELGVKNYQELWKKVEGEYEGLSREVPAEFTRKEIKNKKEEVEIQYSMVLSTDDEDRHGDVVKQEWDLKWFKKNPVLLDSHNYNSIEHIIGKLENVRVEDNKLKADIKFNLSNSKGLMAQNMVDEGFINANSVGFIPKEFDDKGNILKSELLEDSLVSVPANPRALFEKKVKEIKEEVKEIEKEVKEKKEIEPKKITALEKKQATLRAIKNSIERINKEEVRKQKRLIQIALRNL